MKTLTVGQWAKGRNIVDLTHYQIAWHGWESWKAKTIVIDPALTEPTFILRPRTTKATKHNILALALPSMSGDLREPVWALLGVKCTYATLAYWDKAERTKGLPPSQYGHREVSLPRD